MREPPICACCRRNLQVLRSRARGNGPIDRSVRSFADWAASVINETNQSLIDDLKRAVDDAPDEAPAAGGEQVSPAFRCHSAVSCRQPLQRRSPSVPENGCGIGWRSSIRLRPHFLSAFPFSCCQTSTSTHGTYVCLVI